MIAAIVVVPIVAGLLCYLAPRRAEALVTSVAAAIAFASAAAVAVFRDAPDESVRWLVQPFTAAFHFGLGPGPGTWIALMLGLVAGCALAVTRVPRRRDFVAQMLVLLGAMMGVFLARDLLTFALFWDLQLVPVFLILVGWAPEGKSGSAWRYLVYNLSGGLALLLATAAYGMLVGTTDVLGSASAPAPAALQGAALWWVFAGLGFAFLIKTPVWPFHTWMPDTYADLPAPAAAVVSAVQSKGGLYGFIVIATVLLPGPMHAIAPLMFALGLIGLVYGACVALVLDDAKRVVAYSSLSHLGLILVAIFTFNPLALGGAIVYVVAHGLFSAGLFITLGEVELREETRFLSRLGGLGERNPKLAGALTIMVLAALGLPGLAGFAGEILILTGVYQAGYPAIAALSLVPIVLAAAYMVRVLQATMHGPEIPDLPQREDMTVLELAAFAPLVVAVLLLGIAPGAVARSANAIAASPAVATLSLRAARR
jgi:NADH-quinone oxidoreductase subunit M